jgi:hypothetical protein
LMLKDREVYGGNSLVGGWRNQFWRRVHERNSIGLSGCLGGHLILQLD